MSIFDKFKSNKEPKTLEFEDILADPYNAVKFDLADNASPWLRDAARAAVEFSAKLYNALGWEERTSRQEDEVNIEFADKMEDAAIVKLAMYNENTQTNTDINVKNTVRDYRGYYKANSPAAPLTAEDIAKDPWAAVNGSLPEQLDTRFLEIAAAAAGYCAFAASSNPNSEAAKQAANRAALFSELLEENRYYERQEGEAPEPGQASPLYTVRTECEVDGCIEGVAWTDGLPAKEALQVFAAEHGHELISLEGDDFIASGERLAIGDSKTMRFVVTGQDYEDMAAKLANAEKVAGDLNKGLNRHDPSFLAYERKAENDLSADMTEAPEPGQDAAPEPSAKERMAAKLEGFFDREPPQEPEAAHSHTPTRGMD